MAMVPEAGEADVPYRCFEDPYRLANLALGKGLEGFDFPDGGDRFASHAFPRSIHGIKRNPNEWRANVEPTPRGFGVYSNTRAIFVKRIPVNGTSIASVKSVWGTSHQGRPRRHEFRRNSRDRSFREPSEVAMA